MARLLWDGCVCRGAVAGREVLLLSVKTGHSLHMHSVDAAIKHKIIESSDWKKHPKLTAKKVAVVKQTVHNLQTGTFEAKGIDQQKRFNNSPQTPKKAVYQGRWGGLDTLHSFLLSQPAQEPLC